jgi:hypothetical protein
MARTVTEIQQAIFTAKNADPDLSTLNSSSQSAIWRKWVYIVALAIHLHERFFDIFKSVLQDILASRQPGTGNWYAEKCLEFQLGDNLVYNKGFVGYSIIDPSKQIVTKASFKEDSGALTLKVAKGGETLESLSAEEKQQFDKYIEQIKYSGTNVTVISQNADKMRLTAEVFYNGIYALNIIQTACEEALNEYLRNLPFDGKVYLNSVIDALQEVEGVNDVAVSSLEIVTGSTPATVTRVLELPSGYLLEDDAQNSFADLITYTAE